MTFETELSETKLGLILAAEKLFAIQGIAATTIRQINAVAGQKNQSAIHYHFGSRDAILDAIMELRVTPVNIARERMIAEARTRAGDRPLTTEEIVHLLVDPNIDRLMSGPGPHYSARFVLQLRVNHDMWRRYERTNRAWTLDEVHAEMRRARPFLPKEVVRSRFRQAVNLSMISNAEIELAQERLGARFSREEAEFRIEEKIGLLIALIDAPVTPGAVRALQRARRDALEPALETPQSN